jgi:hypothetical protein
LIVCSPQYARFSYASFLLQPLFLAPAMLVGIVCIIVSIVKMAERKISLPIDLELYLGDDPDTIFGRFQTGLLFPFLPALLLSYFNLIFLHADLFYRFMQPIRGMDDPSPAEENVLLDYVSPDLITNIFKAFGNGHYRVAWHALLSLGCTSSPIIAGRIFAREDFGNGLVMVVTPINFYISFAMLCFYCVIAVFAIPGPKYRAPRMLLNLMDLVTFCYDSTILKCSEFCVQDKTYRQIHLQSQVYLAKRKYQFGMYLGLSGRRHLGFDVEERTDDSGNRFKPVDRIVYRGGEKSRRFGISWFSSPQIIATTARITQNPDSSASRDPSNAENNSDSDSRIERERAKSDTSAFPTAASGTAIPEGEAGEFTPSRQRRIDTEMEVGFHHNPRHGAARASALEESSVIRRPTRRLVIFGVISVGKSCATYQSLISIACLSCLSRRLGVLIRIS